MSLENSRIGYDSDFCTNHSRKYKRFVLNRLFCFAAFLLLTVTPAQAQFVVNNTGDEPDVSAVDGVCLTATGACTLRAAIQQANASAGANTIDFSIPGAGPYTIMPATALPIITGPVTIDGYTQPGASPNTNPTDPAAGPRLGSNAVLMIVLNGGGLNVPGLQVQGGSSTIRGLVINGFDADKIFISGGSGNVIEGNFIGTDVTGMIDASAVGRGIHIFQSSSNVIGGVLPAQRNVIAGNNVNIFVNLNNYTLGPGLVRIQGNLIGTNAAGTAVLGAGPGIALAGGSNPLIRPPDNHIIGGTDGDDGVIDGLVQARNIISGHTIGIHNTGSRGTMISGNFIGTDVTGTQRLGDFSGIGIEIDGISSDTFVGGWEGSSPVGAANIICCANVGISIQGNNGSATAGVKVQGNSIGQSGFGEPLGNGSIGIDLNMVSGVLIGGPVFAFDTNVVAYTGSATSHPGFRVSNSADAKIESNIIMNNAGRGIHVQTSSKIHMTKNHIFSNGLLGIDLQSTGQLASFVTPNDDSIAPFDSDTGTNGLQNFPELISATGTRAPNGTVVTGILKSTPNSTFTIEFFGNHDADKDPSGYGEGSFWWGSIPVTTDPGGIVNINHTIAPGLPAFPGVITATATDALGNTSEFSNWVPVTILNSAPVANAGADFSADEGVLVTLNGTGSFDLDGNPLTYRWRQLPVDTVNLQPNNMDPTPSFNAPTLTSGSTTLTFELIVNDGFLDSAPDIVNVTVVNVNQAPIAMVGPGQTVNEGSQVTLDGSASFDPDNDPITYRWNQITGPSVLAPNTPGDKPAVTAPMISSGSLLLEFELIVNDGFVDSVPAIAQVTVVNVNQAPIANAGPDQTRDEGTLVTLNGTSSFDPDGQAVVSYLWTQIPSQTVALNDSTSPTPSFTAPLLAPGTQETLRFSLIAGDGELFSAPDEVVITVQDVNAPPACNLAQAAPSILWPVNHGLERVDIGGVTDPDNNPIAITVLEVTQDEPVSGLDRHDVSPDAVIQPDHVLLRRERDKNGNGRVYHIDFRATDSTGASCVGLVKVHAPIKRHSASVDDGAFYDSLVP